MTSRPTRPDEPLVGPSSRAVVEVTGEDRVSYLDDVLSQLLEDVEPGRLRSTLQLEVKGSPTALFDVAALEDRLLLITPDRDVAGAVVDDLGAKTFLADATFRHREDLALLALRGEGARRVAAGAELPGSGDADLSVAPGAVLERGEWVLVGREEGLDVIAGEDAVATARKALVAAGATAVAAEDLEAFRIAAGEPGWGTEVCAPHLPEEMGLLPTHVHLDKGCYPGQEAVARMWMLGKPRRRLAAVDLEGEVEPGWETGSGRKKVRVTSAATYGGRAVGLGYVPADAGPGDAYREEGRGLVVREVVGAGLPVPGHDPSVTRRRDR